MFKPDIKEVISHNYGVLQQTVNKIVHMGVRKNISNLEALHF